VQARDATAKAREDATKAQEEVAKAHEDLASLLAQVKGLRRTLLLSAASVMPSTCRLCWRSPASGP
jgi:hypothetical protein